MFIEKFYNYIYPRSPIGTSMSSMPDEILKKIFIHVSYGVTAVHFSRVCKKFNAFYNYCDRPIYRMLSSGCKTIEFVQKNIIGRYFLSGQDTVITTVITVVAGKYVTNKSVIIWNSGKPSRSVTGNLSSSFFNGSIDFVATGGTTVPCLAVAESGPQGRIQVWSLQDQKMLKEANLGRAILSLCGSENFLIARFVDGTVGLYNFSDLEMIKELRVHTSYATFVFFDSSIKKIITLADNGIKIWDFDSLSCIGEIKPKHLFKTDLISYDLETHILFGACRKEGLPSAICFWNGEDGNEIAAYQCPNQKGEFTALHLCPKAGLIFGAYSYYEEENSKSGRSGIAVWDIKSKQLLKDFPAFLRVDPSANLHEKIYVIDFDPESRIIMTCGAGINIWSLEEGLHVRRLNVPLKCVKDIQWVKDQCRLFFLMSDKLYLIDYSIKPFQVVGQ